MSKKKVEKEVLPPNVEHVEYKDITFTCPVRGKVTQKVKVVKYKPKQIETDDMVKTSDPMINDFDMGEITGLDDEPQVGSDD